MGDEADMVRDRWYEDGCPPASYYDVLEEVDYPGATNYTSLVDDSLDSLRYMILQTYYPVRAKTYTATTNINEGQLVKEGDIEPMRSKQDLIRELEAVKATQARLEDRITKLSRYPDEDPLQDGDVITFVVGRENNIGWTQYYSYAAIRAGGQYYMTGTTSRRVFSWSALVNWLTASGVEHVLVMSVRYDLLNRPTEIPQVVRNDEAPEGQSYVKE